MADKDEDIIKDALERFEESQDGSDYNREAAFEDIKFARMADQWPRKIREQRKQEGRPCLTINRLPSFIRQVVNDSRQNKPGITVAPVDDGADEDTAQVISGLVRSIERGSNAEIAYDTAIDHACSGGFGFFRIAIDFINPMSFDMEARIERVPNPLMVHWDTSSTQFDASDWNYAFVSDFLTEDEFETRYPDAEKVSFEGDPRDQTDLWIDNEKIRVAEYFEKTAEPGEIVLLSDGRVVREDELIKMAKAGMEAAGLDPTGGSDDEIIRAMMDATGITEVKRRQTTFTKVKRRIINNLEVLEGKGEEGNWPGSTIPICPVWGEEVYHEGRRHFRSMVRDATDPQLMFNFWRSATTELVALAPKTPWVGPENFVPKGKEELWQTANSRSHAYLEYSGQIPPQRQPFAQVPAGALQEALSASDDMKAIMGVFDTEADFPAASGKAILVRQRTGNVSTFHFVDNLSRAIRYAGRVLVDIIPSVYGMRETVRILGEDRKEQVIHLKQVGGEPVGSGKLYDFNVGKYDVTVSAGPSYSTQREEAREILIEIMRTVPTAAPIVGDILADNLDFVGAEKLRDRLRVLLPPEIQKAENEENKQDLPPEAQAIVQQAGQQVEQLTQQLQQVMTELQRLQGEVDDKEGELALKAADLQTKQQDNAADQEIEAAKLELEAAKVALEERKVALAERKQEFDEAFAIADKEREQEERTPEFTN